MHQQENHLSKDEPTVPALLDEEGDKGRNGTPSATLEEGTSEGGLSYDPVPPRRSFHLQVSCRLQGRGQPLPFPPASW